MVFRVVEDNRGDKGEKGCESDRFAVSAVAQMSQAAGFGGGIMGRGTRSVRRVCALLLQIDRVDAEAIYAPFR